MKQSIILSIFILGIVFSGCIDSINNKKIDVNSINDTKNFTIKSESKEILSKSYDDIYVEIRSFTDNHYSKCYITKSLTQFQCNEEKKEYINHIKNDISGHYVKWFGEVEDVSNDGTIIVKITGFNKSENYQWIAGVTLYNIQREKLIKFNKNDKISFTGKIMKFDDTGSGLIGNWKNLKLYDVNIEEKE